MLAVLQDNDKNRLEITMHFKSIRKKLTVEKVYCIIC